eukprot:TRINITY_DN123402_c0_g1_i1.p1 TRINITY_DN123402_c0_g1~~TRINITY_DN123402_c0_g1_i1.p1  ORF type:complete len:223 (-),score=6.54 TRINITY_DN123402_c0_g1_i1:51-719(-)
MKTKDSSNSNSKYALFGVYIGIGVALAGLLGVLGYVYLGNGCLGAELAECSITEGELDGKGGCDYTVQMTLGDTNWTSTITRSDGVEVSCALKSITSVLTLPVSAAFASGLNGCLEPMVVSLPGQCWVKREADVGLPSGPNRLPILGDTDPLSYDPNRNQQKAGAMIISCIVFLLTSVLMFGWCLMYSIWEGRCQRFVGSRLKAGLKLRPLREVKVTPSEEI